MEEVEQEKIASFVNVLNKSIVRKVDVANYSTFDDVCSLALKFECHELDEKKTYGWKNAYNKTTASFCPSSSKIKSICRSHFLSPIA